jgi:hypothetical protein
LSLASVVAVVAPGAGYSALGAIGASLLLLLSILVSLVGQSEDVQGTWFECRAVAESLKSLTWRYMMRVPPYNRRSGLEADRRLIDEFREVLDAAAGIEAYLVREHANDEGHITESMRETRGLPLPARKALYVEHRLGDQRAWYESRAATNRRGAAVWFWATVALQGAALAAGVIGWSGPGLLLVSPLATIASVAVAWRQTRAFTDLSLSYSRAAEELASLRSLADHAGSVAAFADFVEQVEETISREHTMWVARRTVRWVLPGQR